MSTSELERRLGELLQRHAEDAMDDTNTEEELGRLLDDTGRSRRRRRRTWIAGGLVVVAAATALVAWRPDLGSDKAEPKPADQEQQAEQTATSFVEAYADFDPDRAATYLADDAALTIWEDELGNDHWRRGNRVMQALGAQILLDECDARWSAGPATYVSCVFDLHSLGSEQLGRGPYPDNTFSITVNDGKIVDASMTLTSQTNGFSEEMWGDFAQWVTRTHPADAAVMYYQYPKLDFASETARSLALWRQHVKEYVEAKTGP
ncbi:MAG: hypothetical protein ACXWXO_19530 [Nocardioides sp.]